MQAPDFLFLPRWILPVEPAGAVLEDHALAVRGERIAALLPGAEARRRWPRARRVERPNHVVIPGLVNAHTHAGMTLLRGFADDIALQAWLESHIWPAEARHLSEDYVRAGTELALVEMVRSGTTCFADMYFFPDVGAEVAVDRGVRMAVGLPMVDFPNRWAADRQASLGKNAELYGRYRGEAGISFTMAPHAPYSVDDSGLALCVELAEERDLSIHIHVHETAGEIAESLQRHNCRPLARLDRLGVVNERLMAVHATQLEEGEIAVLAERGCSVVHCPQSNLKLASGFASVETLLAAGVNVALGTDSAASNNDLDMIEEMQTAALLAKGVSGNADAVSAAEALEMATLAGARALGLDGEIGSLLPGKAADFVALDLSAANSQPVYDPASQLAYSGKSSQITDVWVRGKALMEAGRLGWGDEDRILAQAREWGSRIGSPGGDPAAVTETQ
ncbi:MAG: TRZ/ATZ family hydrolase [Gammaproteobacteria bacterium]|nr:TRZ/ATZ family hydrolase [Gammaproteobacteria bacterium]MDE0412980.1 TRZ/ATZ family hydrolase [Gammaproteobacteria bacterium]